MAPRRSRVPSPRLFAWVRLNPGPSYRLAQETPRQPESPSDLTESRDSVATRLIASC